MAIIGKIRERSTLVLIVVGGAIMAFVLTDLFSSQTTGAQQGPLHIAEINGVKINPQEFDQRVQETYKNYTERSQQTLDEGIKSELRESVWNEFVSDNLMGSQMDILGINVTTKELFDMVQGDRPHPQVVQVFSNPETGEFNSAAVVQFLQNLTEQDPATRQQWIDFEQALKRNQRINKYNLLIKKAVYTPNELATKQNADNNSAVSFRYIYKPFSALNDSAVQVSEADYKAYYEQHKSEYDQEASHKVTYAYFPVSPSEMDHELAQRWVDDMYEKFKEAENDSLFVNANSDERFDPTYYTLKNIPTGADSSFWEMEVGTVLEPVLVGETHYIRKIKSKKFAPDSVRARHILIDTRQGKEKEGEALADSLLDVINSGTPLYELVSYSDDAQTAKDSGNVGWFTEGLMVKPFNDSSFAAKVGDVIKVKTQFGFHLIEILDQTKPVNKIQIATIERTVLPGKETYANVFNQANSFSINATDNESFSNLITEQNIQQRVAILKESDNLIPGLAASRDLVRWVKESEEGAVSEAYDVDEAFVVAIVDEVNADGPAPLDKVRNRIEFLVRQEKKAEVFKEEFNAIDGDLDAIASEIGLFVETVPSTSFASPAIPNVGLEPKIVAKAVSMEQGEISEAIQGNTGVFIIELTQKTDAMSTDVSLIKNANARNTLNRVDNGAILSALKEKADMVDNRAKFY